MNVTKTTIKYKTHRILISETSNSNTRSLLSTDLREIRKLFFFRNNGKKYNVPKDFLTYGEKIVRTISPSDILSAKYEETLSYSPSHVTCTITFYTLSLVAPPKSNNDYSTVFSIREFAHDPWEPVERAVEWTVVRIQKYFARLYKGMSNAPDRLLWEVTSDYYELHKALISHGFVAISHNKHKKTHTYSLDLA
jgi:hypothetical protein